jgi:hypothetical protein
VERKESGFAGSARELEALIESRRRSLSCCNSEMVRVVSRLLSAIGPPADCDTKRISRLLIWPGQAWSGPTSLTKGTYREVPKSDTPRNVQGETLCWIRVRSTTSTEIIRDHLHLGLSRSSSGSVEDSETT